MADPSRFNQLTSYDQLDVFRIDQVYFWPINAYYHRLFSYFDSHTLINWCLLPQEKFDGFIAPLIFQDRLPYVLTMLKPAIVRSVGFNYDNMIVSCLFDEQPCDKKFVIDNFIHWKLKISNMQHVYLHCRDVVHIYNPVYINCFTFNGDKDKSLLVSKPGEKHGKISRCVTFGFGLFHFVHYLSIFW